MPCTRNAADDGDLLRAVDDVGLERCVGYVDDHARYQNGCARLGIPNPVGVTPDGTVDACRGARRARKPPEGCPLGARAVAELHERLVDEVPEAAVLVCGLESWIDAGFAAARARTTLTEPA